jgi:hypothetical protein
MTMLSQHYLFDAIRLRSMNMARKLNSNFKVVQTNKHSADVLVILESRGGTGLSARNPDYAKQLSRILGVLKRNSCVITRVDLMSQVAINTLKDPKLKLNYPILLAKCSSIESLRKEIQSAQKSVGQRPGAMGGNSTKRIGIFVKVGPKLALLGMQKALS